ncbi:MAG: helix-turn-helix domain-containing protein [Cyclobacteriaceae bacterium]
MSATEIMREIRRSRESEGISQTELSRRVGIPQSHISKIESGAVDIQLSSLEQIARGLGYEVRLIPKSLLSSVERQVESAQKTRGDQTQQALKTISDVNDNLYKLPTDARIKHQKGIDELKYNLGRLKEIRYDLSDLKQLTKILAPVLRPAELIKFEDYNPKTQEALDKLTNRLKKFRYDLVQKVEYEQVQDKPKYSFDEDD